MLTGLKGVKYGLQPAAKPKERAPLQKLSAFADDEEDEEGGAALGNVSTQIARQAAQKSADVKVARAHAAAVAEDPSVFDYDGVYDSIQQQRVVPKQQEKIERKSRYIESLLEKAKDRAREQDIVYERKLAKEREAEDYLFGDKDKFVTAAYKRKLQENKLWQEQDRARQEREAKEEAHQIGHMGNFYKNVLTNNEAFGTLTEKKSKERPVSSRAEGPAPNPAPAAAGAGEGAEWEAARKAREAFEAGQARSLAAQSALTAPPASRAGAEAGPLRAAGRGKEDRKDEGGGEGTRAATAAGVTGGGRDPERGGLQLRQKPVEKPSGAGKGGGSSEPEATESAAEEERGKAGPPPLVGSVPAVNSVEEREAKAAAARERFLARKRKAPS